LWIFERQERTEAMARLNRLVIAGYPHLIMHRVRPGSVVFQDELDARVLVDALHESAGQALLELHGYVLLPDRWMLLVTPRTSDAVSVTMQAIGRRYVRHINQRHGLRGGLWASRFTSTVLDASTWALPSLFYLDLAPVRSGLVQEPKDYPHGTHRHYIGVHHDRHLVVPPVVWAMGNTPFAREAAYAEMVREGLSRGQVQEIDHALQHGWALGGQEFVDQLQLQTERRLQPRPRGRPARSTVSRLG